MNGRIQQLDTLIPLTLEFAGSPYSFDFYVSRHLPADAILGLDAIIDSGWLIDAIHRQLLHVYHALPPLHLAPCSHQALLAYTASSITIPSRTWHRIVVHNPYTRDTPPHITALACTPTLPSVLPLHGASSVAPAHTPYIPLLLCNSGYRPVFLPASVPVAYLAACQILDVDPPSATASVFLAGERAAEQTETETKAKQSGKPI